MRLPDAKNSVTAAIAIAIANANAHFIGRYRIFSSPGKEKSWSKQAFSLTNEIGKKYESFRSLLQKRARAFALRDALVSNFDDEDEGASEKQNAVVVVESDAEEEEPQQQRRRRSDDDDDDDEKRHQEISGGDFARREEEKNGEDGKVEGDETGEGRARGEE